MDRLIKIVEVFTTRLDEIEGILLEDPAFGNLTTRQKHYLEVIGKMNSPTMSEFARKLQLTKPTVTVLTDKLVEKGFLQRVRTGTDKRVIRLRLTPVGEAFNELHHQLHVRFARQLRAPLTETESNILMELLEKVTGSLNGKDIVS